MYKIIENPVEMTVDEMRNKYKGKFIYVVNCEFTEGMSLLKGTPVVVADKMLEGVQEGIYKQFDNYEKYGKTFPYTLYNTDPRYIEVKGSDGKFHRLFEDEFK